MSNVTLFSHAEIVEMAKTDENAKLVLHWEGDISEPKELTPWHILDDIKNGDYTAEQFDEFGYCCTLEDYQREQEEQAE